MAGRGSARQGPAWRGMARHGKHDFSGRLTGEFFMRKTICGKCGNVLENPRRSTEPAKFFIGGCSGSFQERTVEEIKQMAINDSQGLKQRMLSITAKQNNEEEKTPPNPPQ